MSEQEVEQDHGSALSFLDTEEEEYEDSEHGTALIVAGFVGAIPLIGLAEWLGLGMPGFVGGALLAGIGVATAPLWMRYLPALGFDWHVLLQRVSLDDDAPIVESTIKPLAGPDDEPVNSVQVPHAPESDAALFAVRSANETDGVQRFTVEQIVKYCEPNSYKIFIGRSLTQENNPAVQINIYKRHFRFMGASQRGKSSMVAAFLDIVTRTHDKKHMLLAILDKEDRTGKLFGHLPHVASLQIAGDRVKLHARNEDQVLEYLTYIVVIMGDRYKLSSSAVLELPILLVYIEEFLSLKNTFKARVGQAKGQDAKEKAVSDYSTLVYCIEELAQRGLKARVQLLLCAQVEYADDDFKEALVNIDCGFSFCVRPTAAAAAGFRNTELLRRNAKENKVGQAVVETPDCNDLVLAPEYPAEERLIALEKAEARYDASARGVRPLVEPAQDMFDTRMRAHHESAQEAQETVIDTDQYARTSAHENLSDQPVDTAHTAYSERNDYLRMTDLQIELFCVAYGLTGNKDKSLEAAGVNTRYRQHATVIIAERDLKKKG